MGTRFTVIRDVLIAFTWAVVTAVVVQPARAEAKRIVLNCEIEEGSSQASDSTQIMIDEDEGIVIYHYHLLKEPGCLQEFRVEGPLSNNMPRNQSIDICMAITINTDKFIQENDSSSAFVMTKHDGRFVKAYVTPVPTKGGNWVAYGNIHWGKCVKSPFD